MNEIELHADLVRDGTSRDELRARLRSGTLTRLRRGAYVPDEPTDPELRHRRLLDAVVRQLSDQFVVGHHSAALLHGLPTWRGQLGQVQLINGQAGNGKIRPDVRVRELVLAADEVIMLGDYRVTSLPRTVLDLACALPLAQSVAVGDAALRAGMDRAELDRLVRRAKGRHGIGRARTAATLLDARSESPGESGSRVLFHVRGLPEPELQYEVFDEDGVFVARCDAAWPELRTLGEFDGRTKYGELLKPGQSGEQVLFAEKLREDRLRELGWEVVRWTSADLRSPDRLVRRLRRAFDRGRRRAELDPL